MTRLLQDLAALRAEARPEATALVHGAEPPPWLQPLGNAVLDASAPATLLALLPPIDAENGHKAEWWAVADLARAMEAGRRITSADIDFVRRLEAVYGARSDPRALERAVAELYAESRARAETANAYDKIGLEILYYRLDLFGLCERCA